MRTFAPGVGVTEDPVCGSMNASVGQWLASAGTAPDFVDHGSPFPLPPGPEGYVSILDFVTSVLRIRYEVKDLFATSDRIVIRAVAHGIGSEAVHGPVGAGKAYAMDTIHIYRTEADRLAEHWGVRDELGVMVQVGVVPPPDPAVLAGEQAH